MTNEEIRRLLVAHGVPENQAEEIYSNLPISDTTAVEQEDDPVQILSLRLLEEEDWIKKSIIAAKIASINLDT